MKIIKLNIILYLLVNCLVFSCAEPQENKKINLIDVFSNADSLFLNIREVQVGDNKIFRGVARRFVVETRETYTSEFILNKINEFVCDSILDSINIKNYNTIHLSFMKETIATKRFFKGPISDSNNPYSSEHYFFVTYYWIIPSNFFSLTINDSEEERSAGFKCEKFFQFPPAIPYSDR